MSASSLVTIVIVPFFGALLWVTPAITRPTVQFGVRIPGDRAGAPVIRRERRAYYWRTAAIGVCFTITAVLVQGHAIPAGAPTRLASPCAGCCQP